MLYEQNLEGVFSDVIGAKGIKTAHLDLYRQKFFLSQEKLKNQYDQGTLPLLKLPYLRKDLVDLEPLVSRFQDDFSDIVVLGTGGSSLGGQTLSVLAKEQSPAVHFMDNIDFNSFKKLFARLELRSTGFIVISKSGGTVETLMQCLYCLSFIREAEGEQAVKNHFLIITEDKESPLTKMAHQWSIPTLAHDPHLGGRFSVLSSVGLLPAMIQGIDVLALREGAKDVLENALAQKKFEENPPGFGAVVAVQLEEKYPNSVMMPYIDDLKLFTSWYRQLWAESLGKKGRGSTPIDALGTVDQHSQLQLYLDGPSDKFFTLMGRKKGKTEVPPPCVSLDGQGVLSEDPLLALLTNRSMESLLRAEYEATRDTLIRNKKPVRTFEFEELTEKVLGGLLMHFMLETIYAADLHEVNAFDQPAVEEGKILAKQYLEKMSG